MSFRAFTILSLFSASLTFAEGQQTLPVRSNRNVQNPVEKTYPISQPKAVPKKAVRKVASVSDKATLAKMKKRVFHSENSMDVRLGLIGGTSNLSTSDAVTQANRDDQQVGKNIFVGINADVRFMRYWGVELDTYYGFAPTQTIDFGNDFIKKTKLQHLGGMFNAKAQYPLFFASTHWSPRLGVGYGLFSLKQKSENELISTTTEATESVQGVYGTIGLDIEPSPWLIISADYARSVAASGKYTENTTIDGDTTNQDIKLEQAQFDRIRVGVFFRVDPSVLLGAQYTRRTISSSPTTGSGTPTLSDISQLNESVSQIGATVLFQF